MTDQQLGVMGWFRIIGPIIMFGAVMGIGVYVMNAPLVLVVVVACLFAIIKYDTLTWSIQRRGDRA